MCWVLESGDDKCTIHSGRVSLCYWLTRYWNFNLARSLNKVHELELCKGVLLVGSHDFAVRTIGAYTHEVTK